MTAASTSASTWSTIRPVAAVDAVAAVRRQQPVQAEARLAEVDGLLLAGGDRLGSVLDRRQIERHAVVEVAPPAAAR